MKTFFTIVLTFFISYSAIGQKTYTGDDIYLTSQQEVNDFGANEYKIVEATINIGAVDDTEGDITDLSPLNTIEEIRPGADDNSTLPILDIKGLDIMTNLDGFENLKSIKGGFSISRNDKITEINGFTSLTTVNGAIMISQNPELKTIEGFTSMKEHYTGNSQEHTYDLTIQINSKLESFHGFRNLEKAHRISLLLNQSLVDLDGLCSIKELLDAGSVKGGISITSCDNIEDCYALCGLSAGPNGVTSISGKGDCGFLNLSTLLNNVCKDDPSKKDCASTTSTTSYEVEPLDAHPNPVTDRLVLNELPIGSTISLYSATGQLLKSTKAKQEKQYIDMSALSTGFYIVTVVDSGITVSSAKISKQ